jgi:hypothetical protein
MKSTTSGEKNKDSSSSKVKQQAIVFCHCIPANRSLDFLVDLLIPIRDTSNEVSADYTSFLKKRYYTK